MTSYHSILLIDDDPTQTIILKAYFQQLGVSKIETSSDPTIGLEYLRDPSSEVDLIVSDLQMPQMDGFEFLRHLKTMGYSGELALFSGVEQNLLEHAGRLARMHNLNLIGQLKKPLNKPSLDSVFLKADLGNTKGRTQAVQKVTEDELIEAIKAKEIRAFYQPQVEIATGRIMGAETLARWEKPGAGTISPEAFIHLAEDTGRVDELTFYLYEQVLEDIQTFLRFDSRQKFAINLSPTMIHDIQLPDRLSATMLKHNVAAKNLCFEVTENSLLDLDTTTLEVLSRLRIHGYEVAIDDFGTGSSNIQTLRDFPYSELKVDRAFVHKAYQNDFSAQTLSAAAGLATQMQMETVAEGVEDINDWNFVRDVGINYVQGYFVSKALSPLAYMDFLTKNQGRFEIEAARSAA